MLVSGGTSWGAADVGRGVTHFLYTFLPSCQIFFHLSHSPSIAAICSDVIGVHEASPRNDPRDWSRRSFSGTVRNVNSAMATSAYLGRGILDALGEVGRHGEVLLLRDFCATVNRNTTNTLQRRDRLTALQLAQLLALLVEAAFSRLDVLVQLGHSLGVERVQLGLAVSACFDITPPSRRLVYSPGCTQRSSACRTA